MRLLDRYLLRELLIPLTYCLGGFLLFWIVFNLFGDQLQDFQKARLTFLDIVQYYLVTTPEQLNVILPVALLLALLYALTNHARHHELTAMRAAGISLWRLSLPYLGVGFFFSVLLFISNEWWVPRTQAMADHILNRHNLRQSTASQWRSQVVFQNTRDQRTWSIQAYNLQTAELVQPTLVWLLPDGSRREINARRGVYAGDAWVLTDVMEHYYATTNSILFTPIRTNQVVLSGFSETPDLIRSELKINSLTAIQAARKPQLSIEEIRNYLQLHPQLGRAQRALLETQLHGRLAGPWTCFMVVLIALPFGAPSGRRNAFAGVASSIFLCFIYFILLRVGLTLGTGERLTPWLAAWLPNLVFGATGIWLTLRVR